MTRSSVFSTLVAAVGTVAVAIGESGPTMDWPQWRGPDRNGLSTESALLTEWPANGPPVVWSASELGAGYGSVAIHDERLYVQGLRGSESTVFSLSLDNGDVLWSRAVGPGANNYEGSGPRGTPTVDGDRLYVLTERGDLACLRADDGTVLWQRNILDDFGGRNPPWLISESPLVDGQRVFVTPGSRDGSVVALDKLSGETIWTSSELSDEAGYASIIVGDVQGVRTLMTLTGRAGVGVRASDGKLMWRYPRVSNSTANIATPIFHNDKVFYTSAYGRGGALLSLHADGGSVVAEETYFTRDLQNHHGGVVLVDGYLYGFNNSTLTCLEFATGRMMWRHRSVGKGSLTYADGHLYVLSENNTVGLVEAVPDGYREKGRFRVVDQGWPSRAHPVVSDGRLFIRNQQTLASYDIRSR